MQGVIGLKLNNDITPGQGEAGKYFILFNFFLFKFNLINTIWLTLFFLSSFLAPVPRAIAILSSASGSTVKGMAIFTSNATSGVDVLSTQN